MSCGRDGGGAIIAASLYHDIMRTTVTLDDDVYEAAQTLARSSGMRLGKVLSDLARKGLRPPVASRRKAGRFATFDVPHGAPVVPASRIQKFIDEEGLS